MSFDDFWLEGDGEFDGFDENEDSMPTLQLIQRRKVRPPNGAPELTIEAQTGEESVFIKVESAGGRTLFFCFMTVDESTEKDFLDPSLVLDTLEEKLRDGLLYKVEDYFESHGRNITDPIEFHIGLRALCS